MSQHNSFGQPIGAAVPGWSRRPVPARTPMTGRYCRLEVLDPDLHGQQLYAAYSEAADGRNWTYLTTDPPAGFSAYHDWLKAVAQRDDPLFHAIVDAQTASACGVAAFMRIDPASGVIELGNINFSQRLKQTRAGTEAIYLMMRRAFDELGYRRCEWKCDSLNAPSRAAAQRYGFGFEGVFRQALVYKGRNRDTAWYAVIDSEWPDIRQAFETWLHPGNFDTAGRQREKLSCPRRRPREGMDAVD